MSSLTATRTVMDLVWAVDEFPGNAGHGAGEGSARFESHDDDTGAVRRSLRLDFGSWADMGRPNQITVTIEPGDRLNTEAV